MMSPRTIPKSKAAVDYRAAFENFSRKVRHFQCLTAQEKADPAEVEAALIAVELARMNYNTSRDALACEMLRQSPVDIQKQQGDGRSPERLRTKAMAKLLWDLSGRPEGTAEQNWLRAERMVRRAAARAACC